MFTGLVQDLGEVAVEASDDGAVLRIATALAAGIATGDSVAVNGVCLTATAVDAQGFTAEAMHETLRNSSLGALADGDRVNLELALRAGDRLGGHVVQGHVDGTGTVVAEAPDGFSTVLTVEADPALLRYVVHKGSITVDGVSLTVSRVDASSFDVSLIPETLERTTLGGTHRGRTVNLEVDVMAKYVEKLVGPYAP